MGGFHFRKANRLNVRENFPTPPKKKTGKSSVGRAKRKAK